MVGIPSKIVFSIFLVFFLTAIGLTQENSEQATVKEKTELRSAPSASADAVRILPEGTILAIEAAVSEKWLLVTSGDQRGYVLAKNVKVGEVVISAEPPKPERCDFSEPSEVKNNSSVAVPSRADADVLVSEILKSFNESLVSGDFSHFWANKIAERWRSKAKPGDFTKGFKEFLDKDVEISRIEGRSPEYSPCPFIDTKYDTDVLFLSGFYDTRPLPVRFSLEFIQEAQEWRLVFISVNTNRW